MFCTNCGHEIAEGSAFCTNCRKAGPSIPAPAPAPAEPSVSEQPEPIAPQAEPPIPPVPPAEPPVSQAEPPAPEPSEPAVVAPQDGPAVDDMPTTCLAADDGAGEAPAAAPSPMPEPVPAPSSLAPEAPAPFQPEPPAAPPVDNSPQVEPAFRRIRLRPSRFQRGSRGPRMFSHSLFRGRRSSRMQRCRQFPAARRRLHRGQLPLRRRARSRAGAQQMLRPRSCGRSCPRALDLFNGSRRSALRARRWRSRFPVCSLLSRYSAWRGTSSTRRSSNEPGRNHRRDLEEHLSFYDDPRQARAIACFPRPIASFPAWVLTAIRMTRHIPRGSTKRPSRSATSPSPKMARPRRQPRPSPTCR